MALLRLCEKKVLNVATWLNFLIATSLQMGVEKDTLAHLTDITFEFAGNDTVAANNTYS